MDKQFFAKEVVSILEKHASASENQLALRWNCWDIDLEEQETFEVIGGLVARQITITNYFLSSSSNWGRDIHALYIRPISETYINIAWILQKETQKRARMFVVYGLSRAKIQREKYRSILRTEQIEELAAIEREENFWDRYRHSSFTDINFGSWSEKDLRTLSNEIDENQIYDFYIDANNDLLHGSFNALVNYNLETSENPLHRFIQKPCFLKPNVDFAVVYAMIQLLQRTFKILDERITPKEVFPDVQKETIMALTELEDKFNLTHEL